MSTAETKAYAVPLKACQRLLDQLQTFAGSVDEGLSGPVPDERQAARWRRAAALLARDLEATRAAVAAAAAGSCEDVIAEAGKLRFLARHMDGYRLDFAGSELGERLETERRLLVLTAWQIHAAGTGSNASGL